MVELALAAAGGAAAMTTRPKLTIGSRIGARGAVRVLSAETGANGDAETQRNNGGRCRD